MPLPHPVLAALAFVLAGGLAAAAARELAHGVEAASVEAVAGALAEDGHAWASVVGDGLQVVIEGEAPTEAARFRAISAAGGEVDASRVIDNMRVTPARAVPAPEFAVEILRNDAGVSLIGLIPADTDRAALARRIEGLAAGAPVTDLLQVADHPVPDGWEPALGFALGALEDLPRAKISVAAGRVAIEAVTDAAAERDRLESTLTAARPDGVTLALDVTAPRPVIAPFALRLTLGEGEARIEACAADTEAAAAAIAAAAAAAGVEGRVDCPLGLGAPSPEWGAAAALGIDALGRLGGGTLTVTDADMALVAAAGTDRAAFEAVAGELEGALPAPFVLRAERLAAAAAPSGPAEFRATLTEAGARLQGGVATRDAGEVARTFARARFGGDAVTMATRVAPGLPEGWSVRVLAGIDALAHLADGEVVVTADRVVVTGRAGRREAGAEIARSVAAALGPEARLDVDVAYVESLDPLAALPTPEECLARIGAVTAEAKITFDPGSATISGEGEPVVEVIGEILKACADLRLRIAGYTDGQGRESSNLALSQARAEAVLDALRALRVPVSGFEAVGLGEADPIADNGTEAGREANRRIEFSLLGAAPAQGGPMGPAPAAAGGDASAEAAQEAPADE